MPGPSRSVLAQRRGGAEVERSLAAAATVWPLRGRPSSVVVLGLSAAPFKRSTGTDHAWRASATL